MERYEQEIQHLYFHFLLCYPFDFNYNLSFICDQTTATWTSFLVNQIHSNGHEPPKKARGRRTSAIHK